MQLLKKPSHTHPSFLRVAIVETTVRWFCLSETRRARRTTNSKQGEFVTTATIHWRQRCYRWLAFLVTWYRSSSNGWHKWHSMKQSELITIIQIIRWVLWHKRTQYWLFSIVCRYVGFSAFSMNLMALEIILFLETTYQPLDNSYQQHQGLSHCDVYTSQVAAHL